MIFWIGSTQNGQQGKWNRLREEKCSQDSNLRLPTCHKLTTSTAKLSCLDSTSGCATITQRTTGQSNGHILKFRQFRPDRIRQRPKILPKLSRWASPIIEGNTSGAAWLPKKEIWISQEFCPSPSFLRTRRTWQLSQLHALCRRTLEFRMMRDCHLTCRIVSRVCCTEILRNASNISVSFL